MALFGAPLSQEDHARRACHAALHLAGGHRRPGRFDVRIGLNSGEVVVGGIGAEGRLEYTALGHTVGLAQRMESMAEPGTVYLTGHTARLVRRRLRPADLGLAGRQGFERAAAGVPASRASAAAPADRRRLGHGGPGRGDGGPRGGAGRGPGRPRSGRRGSRRGRGRQEPAVRRVLPCRVRPGDHWSAGWPASPTPGTSPSFRSSSCCGSTSRSLETDTRGEARAKVADRLLDLDPALDESLPLLFDFLEVPDPERPAPQLAPCVRLERIFGIIRQVTQAPQQPRGHRVPAGRTCTGSTRRASTSSSG